MATTYYGRDLRQCQKTEWLRLRQDDSYRIVRQFQNGVVKMSLEWLGEVKDASNSFPVYWPMFKMHAYNINEYGRHVADPIWHDKTFGFEHDAIAAYEKFLATWTECELSSGVFTEVGNELTPPPPPPPPDPDEPTSSAGKLKGVVDDGVGAW